jgi:hypothetical protein
MSWYATGWLKSCHFGGRGIHKGVALVIGDYCNADGRAAGIEVPEGWEVCWAGYDVLAKDAEWDERTVRRVVSDLSEAGVFEVRRRHDSRTGHRTSDAIFLQLHRAFVIIPEGWESTRERKERQARDRSRGDRKRAGQALAAPGSSRASLTVDIESEGAESDPGLADPGVTAYRTPGSGPSGPRGPFPHTPYKEEPPVEPPGSRQDHLGDATTEPSGSADVNPDSSDAPPADAAATPPAPEWTTARSDLIRARALGASRGHRRAS